MRRLVPAPSHTQDECDMDELLVYQLPQGVKDFSEHRYGRLRVVMFSHRDRNKVAWWWCKCNCGSYVVARVADVKRLFKQSCGCQWREGIHKSKNRTHGLSRTRIHGIHGGILERCFNPANSSYNNYGGRGITVCVEWQRSVSAFAQWAFANGYADDLEIDRRDNEGNYEPANCRWVTSKVNHNNKRSNRRITVGGHTLTVTQWAEVMAVDPQMIFKRLQCGWPQIIAVTTPPLGKNQKLFPRTRGRGRKFRTQAEN